MRKWILLGASAVLAACQTQDLVAVHATVATGEYIAFQYTTADVGVPHPPPRITAAARRHCRGLNKRADTGAADIADQGRSRAQFWTVKIACVSG